MSKLLRSRGVERLGGFQRAGEQTAKGASTWRTSLPVSSEVPPRTQSDRYVSRFVVVAECLLLIACHFACAERWWGHLKRLVRDLCEYNMAGLIRLVWEAYDDCGEDDDRPIVSVIRSFFEVAWFYVWAYGEGGIKTYMSYKALKKEIKHRGVSDITDSIIREKLSEGMGKAHLTEEQMRALELQKKKEAQQLRNKQNKLTADAFRRYKLQKYRTEEVE